MSALVPAQRQDGTLLWIPSGIAEHVGAVASVKLTADQLAHPELAALIESRQAAEAKGVKTDRAWHKKNGYL